MEIYKTQSSIASKSNWLLSLVVITLITIGVLFVLQGIALFLVPPLFGVPIGEILSIITGESDHPQGRMAFLFIQGLGAGLGFAVAALIIAKFVDKADFEWKQQIHNFKFIGLGLTILIMFGGILFNALLIDWNVNITFPDRFNSFERMLREKEDQLMEMTIYLTNFESIEEFLMGLLVIGVFAGVGEELLFRGVIQPKLHQYTGNAHAGIWLTAIIFSAIHFQFYGFLPRMVLGAIFGYLYYFSGSLLYPIIAHILNNAFTVILVYLNKLGKVNFNIEETDQVSIPFALLGLAILIFGMKIFKQKYQSNPSNGELDKNI